MKNPDRRRFMIAGGAGLAGLALSGMKLSYSSSKAITMSDTEKTHVSDKKPANPDKTSMNSGKALVFWYSQTSNTGRTGRCIAKTLEKSGLSVRAADYRDLKPEDLGGANLIVAGSPVYYYDVPSNFKQWLQTIPSLSGKSVASFVTFGGEGGNQHNTACTLLDLLTDKGGRPVGLGMFGNMSTYAITWSMGNTGRILKYSHLPDAASYGRMKDFALSLVDGLNRKSILTYKKNPDFRNWIKGNPSIQGSRLLISRHEVDKNACVSCGTCTQLCPVSAIDPEHGTVNSKTCILCLGCVNNCPSKAVVMTFMGKRVIGHRDFIQEQKIKFTEPEEVLL